MPTLLHLDSSPLGEASISRHLTSEFVDSWKLANPDGKVITRDLTKSGLVTIDAAWIGAAYTPEASRTAEQRQALALSDELLEELFAADEYVFGVPMHNFSIPGRLQAVDRPDCAGGQDVRVCGRRAEGPADGQEGDVPDCLGRGV